MFVSLPCVFAGVCSYFCIFLCVGMSFPYFHVFVCRCVYLCEFICVRAYLYVFACICVHTSILRM